MLRNELTKFIQDNLLRNDPTAIGPEDSLIDSGIMNSTALIRLVSFIENRTGLRIPDAMIIPDNFETVTAIEQTINQVRQQRGG
jgi:acyl carrier protein